MTLPNPNLPINPSAIVINGQLGNWMSALHVKQEMLGTKKNVFIRQSGFSGLQRTIIDQGADLPMKLSVQTLPQTALGLLRIY
ncbi:hypothetical protein ACFLZ9_00250 [Patescibacteria group bacterium]